MKTKHHLPTILLLLILIIHLPNAIATDTTSIIVDKHWIGIFQHDNPNTLTIEEQLFINNTGNQPFTENITLWLPTNSTIQTQCCGNQTNTASRIAHQQCIHCFPLKPTTNNLYTGLPFTTQNPLSYYHQTHNLNITLTQNNTPIDTITLKITLGTHSTPRNTTTNTTKKLYLTSENQQIGITPIPTLDMHFNISHAETITITNNHTTTQNITLQTSTPPIYWKATFYDNNTPIHNLTIPPQQQKQLQLLITTPSYITPIFIQYTTTLQTHNNLGTYTKHYLYNTTTATYYFYLLHNTKNQLDENLTQIHPFEGQQHWDEHIQRYWFVAQQTNITPQTQTHITINTQPQKTTLNYTNILLITAAILLIIIVALSFFFYLKQKNKKQTTTPPTTPTPNKEQLQQLIQRIDKDKTKGILDQKTAQELKADYEQQLKKLEQKHLQQNQHLKQQLQALQQQKKNVFDAIKKLDHEHENHEITEENYHKLRAAYKDKAMKLLQEIDQLKEKTK